MKIKLKGITALALAAVMGCSFSGCKKEKTNPNIKPEQLISDINEDGEKLSILIEVDKTTGDPVFDELYGYFVNDGENGQFYDIIHDKTIDFNDTFNNHFDVYYSTFEDVYFQPKAIVSKKDRQNYAANEGITFEDLIFQSDAYHSYSGSHTDYYTLDYNSSFKYFTPDCFTKFDAKTYFGDNKTLEKQKNN